MHPHQNCRLCHHRHYSLVSGLAARAARGDEHAQPVRVRLVADVGAQHAQRLVGGLGVLRAHQRQGRGRALRVGGRSMEMPPKWT